MRKGQTNHEKSYEKQCGVALVQEVAVRGVLRCGFLVDLSRPREENYGHKKTAVGKAVFLCQPNWRFGLTVR